MSSLHLYLQISQSSRDAQEMVFAQVLVLAYFDALLAAIVELPGHSNCERGFGDGDRHGDEGGAVSNQGGGDYGIWRRRRSRNMSSKCG